MSVKRKLPTIFADPHEIANVLGTAGIELMLTETEAIPLDVFFMLPSCVPATEMETSGTVLTAAKLEPLVSHPRVLGLGEMMNYPGTINAAAAVLDKLALAGCSLCDGHAPPPPHGRCQTPQDICENACRSSYFFLPITILSNASKNATASGARSAE